MRGKGEAWSRNRRLDVESEASAAIRLCDKV